MELATHGRPSDAERVEKRHEAPECQKVWFGDGSLLRVSIPEGERKKTLAVPS